MADYKRTTSSKKKVQERWWGTRTKKEQKKIYLVRSNRAMEWEVYEGVQVGGERGCKMAEGQCPCFIHGPSAVVTRQAVEEDGWTSHVPRYSPIQAHFPTRVKFLLSVVEYSLELSSKFKFSWSFVFKFTNLPKLVVNLGTLSIYKSSQTY